MSPLYLYAVLVAPPDAPLGVGLAGEPLRLVHCGDVVAVAGEMGTTPALGPDVLRGHDAVVRRLVEMTDALLPARFGAVAAGDGDLCDRLARAGVGLREALVRVAGHEQMILRVYATTATTTGDFPQPAPTPGGPGARYLAGRAQAQRRVGEVAELAAIQPVLARFVAAERVERHEALPLVASVYHLLRRGTAPAYTAAVEEAAKNLTGVRVTVSGPWAPYAFAPEPLG